MAQERSVTPISGRSTPLHRIPRQNLEDGVDTKDKGYRRYAASVERALASFDTTEQEWADYISFLGRLLKSLQTRPNDIHIIPESQTVSLRLAQCLSPALPSGVHQKALEVYAFVFSILKNDALSHELDLYLPGLSSVLSFASLSVRPLFLALFDHYIVPLDLTTTRPALKAIILSLLPGLEDDTSEDFNRVLETLDKFRNTDSKELAQQGTDMESQRSFFWQCFFLATITSTSRRQGALAYLIRKLPKFSINDTIGSDGRRTQDGNDIADLSQESRAALSPEPGLLVRCLAVGLSDSHTLIQRGFLDLLVTHLPLHSVVLQRLVPVTDLRTLVAAAMGVVARRDMSLNRRLWTWLLGPEPKEAKSSSQATESPVIEKSTHHAAYFARYGLQALSHSILEMFTNADAASVTDRARPFRICLSLMDRWEVGGLLIPDIFVPAIESAYQFSQSANKQEADEIVRSASIFFDGIESGLIWTKFLKLSQDALRSKSSDPDHIQKLELCAFIVQRFNLREEEMISIHIPLVVLAMLIGVKTTLSASSQSAPTLADKLSLTLEIAEKLIHLMPERVFVDESKALESKDNTTPNQTPDEQSILHAIESFYGENHGNLEATPKPLSTSAVGRSIVVQAMGVFQIVTASDSPLRDIETSTRILVSLFKMADASTSPHLTLFIEYLMDIVEDELVEKAREFATSSAVISILVALHSRPSGRKPLASHQISRFQHGLTGHIWPHLSPSTPKHHVEAVRCLCYLDSLSRHRGVEAAVTSLIHSTVDKQCSQTEAGQRFAVLWTHVHQEKSLTADKGQKAALRRASGPYGLVVSAPALADPSIIVTRPSLLLLESLTNEGSPLFSFTRTWIQELPCLNRLFHILLARICSLQSFAQRKQPPDQLQSRKPLRYAHSDDFDELVYLLQVILRMLRYATEHMWLTLAGETVHALEFDRDETSDTASDTAIMQNLLAQICIASLDVVPREPSRTRSDENGLHQVSFGILRSLISSPFSAPLKEMELEGTLLERLRRSIGGMDPLLQASLLETVTAALKLQLTQVALPPLQSPSAFWKGSRQQSTSGSKLSVSKDDTPSENIPPIEDAPPPLLIECLKEGFASPSIHTIIDNWVAFLVDALPLLADFIFQHMIPLVECFCSQIHSVLSQLKLTFTGRSLESTVSPESTLIGLLNGLEQVLAKAHERLVTEEVKVAHPKSPDLPQGFFGSVVQGVFSGDVQQHTRATTANSRLTVLLCFQDTVRTCFSVWCWGLYGPEVDRHDSASSATFSYTSMRMRNRARRLLEHVFTAEALECLETLIALWCRPPTADFQCDAVVGLLNVLSSSRPKRTVPAIFNAIYSRTNPSALDPSRMSSLTAELSDIELVSFLLKYISEIEDDAMDEIWADCMAFLKDILANPMPQRQILPTLLEFTALLAEKVENTNFGDQRRMRRELGDVFLRMLTATFTAKPQGFLQEPAKPASGKTSNSSTAMIARTGDVMTILSSILPKLHLVLSDNERIANAASSISSNVVGPIFRSKAFPANVDGRFLELLHQLTRIPQAAKIWRKDLSDVLNDHRIFNSPVNLVQEHWMAIFRQLANTDKDRMPELISRLSAPTTAGVVFGVGATSARMEADRKTQANLRRIALIILSSPLDTFVTDLGRLHEKLVELFTAKPVSAPSSAMFPEIFVVLRAVILKISGLHLAAIWPTINVELQKAIFSVLPGNDTDEKYSNAAILHACKLLDLLVTTEPDDFQLHEWLFITDTIEAVYKPATWTPTALADGIAETLAAAEIEGTPIAPHVQQFSAATSSGRRRPFLESVLESLGDDVDPSDLRSLPRSELASRVLRPFLGQLSIVAFEETYGMRKPDVDECLHGVLTDLFDGSVSGEA